MELREVIEKLQDIEKSIGSDAIVYVHTCVDEVELYNVDVRQVDERTYEVVIKGRL